MATINGPTPVNIGTTTTINGPLDRAPAPQVNFLQYKETL
jgi:hypothetical protein